MLESHSETSFSHTHKRAPLSRFLAKASVPFIEIQEHDPHFKECWFYFLSRSVPDGLFHFDEVPENHSSKQMGPLLRFMWPLETAVKSCDSSNLV